MVVSHLQWISWLLCDTGDQWDCGLWKEGWDGLYRAYHELVPCSGLVHPAAHYTGWSYDWCAHVTQTTTLLFWSEPCLAPVCSGLDTEETIKSVISVLRYKKLQLSRVSYFYVHIDRFDQETFEQRRNLNLYYYIF